MVEYAPYKYEGKTMLIERYLVLGEQECISSDYNIFDINLNTIVYDATKRIETNGYSEFDIFNELNREGINSFKFYKNAQNKKIFLYSEVISKTKTKILLCVSSNWNSKLWINGKCLSICRDCSEKYFTVYLHKGLNTIVFEQYSPEPHISFYIQLRNYTFEMGNDVRAISNMKHAVQIDPLLLISDPLFRPIQSTFRFMFLQNNNKLKENYRIDIQDSSTGFVKTLDAKLGEVVDIDIDELRNLHTEAIRHERIGCVFNDTEGKEVEAELYILTNYFMKRAVEVNDQLCSECKKQSDTIRDNCMGRILRFDTKGYIHSYWIVWSNRETLNQLESGSYLHEYYKSPGVHEIYIHSKLDDSYIRVGVKIPDDYDRNKAYPVFAILSTDNEGRSSHWMPSQEELPEPCLFFDVTGRGFTAGSYVGEASTFEVFDWINRNYKIDEDRVYILGRSNGGFATWAIAQNHPHIPAAIFPLGSFPQIKTVENITNIPTYQLISPKDYVFKGRENQVKQKICKHGKYHEIQFKEMVHNSFVYYVAHKGILGQMLNMRRERYPDQIIYSTCRNRHLESFWIKLHGIEKNIKFAKIKAIIVNEHLINITAKGASGVTVMLPPQIEKDSFDITVNNKAFHFENPVKSQIHFVRGKSWKTTCSIDSPDYRKGTGLLDVYMNSLRIIVPDDPYEKIKNIAGKFSTPDTNGTFTNVCTKYPIYEPNAVPDHIFGHNLVLLETADQLNPYIKRFANKLPVQYDKTGYMYKGICTEGSYVIMQVIPNPYDSRRTFLIISTNDETLLCKHMLLRKVIIPTYVNGIHPMWNNEILIFNGKKYLKAYEMGDTLSSINFG